MGETPVCLAGQSLRQKITGPAFDAEIVIDQMNQRIKIVNYQGGSLNSLTDKLQVLAAERKIGKIIFFCPTDYRIQAEQAKFLLEGEIPGFFQGQRALCYSFYIDKVRAESSFIAKEDQIIQEVSSNKETGLDRLNLPAGYQIRAVLEGEVEKLVSLYRQVFVSYPSPLLETGYVRQVMTENVYFLAVFRDADLISAGSAEIDLKNSNAEITDLATDQKARGMGLATVIINALEKEMQKRKIRSLYSLARAGIPGVNRVFYKLGYQYRGRMINNCHIGGRYEDMNLWVKIPHPQK